MRRPEEMILVRGTDGLDDVIAKLNHGALAVDTETTGLNWRTDRVGSINLAAGETAVFAYGAALPKIARYLSDQIKASRRFVFHNAKFDMHMLRETFGIHFPYPVHDTALMSHMVNNRGAGNIWASNHQLKPLASKFVDIHAPDTEKEALKAIRAAGGRHKGDWMVLMGTREGRRLWAKYSMDDAWYTLQLYHVFLPAIKHWPQPHVEHGRPYPSLWTLYQNERWLTLCLRDMEARGTRVDREFLYRWSKQLRREKERLEHKLSKYAGRRDVNWRSPDQVREILFNRLNIHTTKMTKGGNKSADKKVLLQIAHPIGQLLTQFRYTAYQESWAQGVLDRSEHDGFIHASFRQNVDTGRMACGDPNMQGVDKKSLARAGFIPRDGLVFRMLDYNQGEMRVAASLANEESLIDKFNNDPHFDAHYGTAQMMFGIEEPDEELRGYGKTMNFAQLFGAGIDVVTEGLMLRVKRRDAIKSCRRLGYRVRSFENPHRVLASLLIQRYNENMPAMKVYAKKREEKAKERGFAITFAGRHRYLDAHQEAYKAFNTEIQGGLADVGKIGLVQVYREMELNRGVLMCDLQVHDEIVYEHDGDPKVDYQTRELMEDHTNWKVPMTAEVKGSTKNWHEKESVKLKRRTAA